jgi:uncharacterized protein (TIGR02588 family)
MWICYFFYIGTDYSRFLYYFVSPILLGNVFYVSALLRYLANENFSDRRTVLIKRWFSSISVVFILITYIFLIIANVSYNLQFFPVIVSRLSLRYESSLLDISKWLVLSKPNRAVYVPSRPEATWIEGLVGCTPVYPEEFWFIYRPGMIDRSVAGNMIATGTSNSINNGFVFLRFQQNPKGIDFNPNISAFHRGAYTNLFSLQDKFISIKIDKEGELLELNLEKDFSQNSSPKIKTDENHAELIFQYQALQDKAVVTKTIIVSNNSPNVNITFDFQSGDIIELVSITFQIADNYEVTDEEVVQKSYLSSIEKIDNGVSIFRRDPTGHELNASLFLSPDPSQLEILIQDKFSDKHYLIFEFSLRALKNKELRLEIIPNVEKPFNEGIRLSTLIDTLKTYDVEYLVINQSSFQTIAVYNSLGFPIVYSNRNYLVYKVTNFPELDYYP